MSATIRYAAAMQAKCRAGAHAYIPIAGGQLRCVDCRRVVREAKDACPDCGRAPFAQGAYCRGCAAYEM